MSVAAMQALHRLRECRLLCDAVVRADDGAAFPVHRAILSACSPYFLRVFCYKLEADARRYLLRYFVTVATQSDEFLHLPLDELNAIILEDELNVKSEEAVWDAVLRWVNYEPDQRWQHTVKLMASIRLGLLDTQFFLENVKDHPYVTGNEGSRPIIIETLKFLYDLEMIAQRDGEVATPEIARPRVPHEVLFAIGGWSGGSPTAFIETYDTRADRWIKVEEVDPAGPRAYHGTAVLGYCIYVIGGFDGMDYFNSCRCFDAVNKTWREVAPMNARRCYVSVAVLGETIYAMGGYDGHHRQNTAERFNHRTNQWSLVAPMNAQRSDASAASLDNKIFITGGFNGQECMNSVEVYDPDTNQWTNLAPMRSRRSGVSCIAYHNKSLLRYEATDMNIYRSALSACVIMGLPNVYDYIHKHRERLMEEKRQKILLSETARHGQHRTALPDVHLMEDNDDMLEQLGLMEHQANNNLAIPPPPPPPLPPQPMEQDRN
ncbi:Kelch-like protein 10 [Papilio xuthus]|uniref:Kelch-like protein 10 n=1 Tax=Papilio xuthus TaxID=66420 RepID=A0A194PVJ6_PAPXU|nr:Kelch-like protein 10 [Papilio xuthus]